jgi:hypothetical protein
MYRVEWSPGALGRMTDAWLDADSALRAAITAAVSQIDERLAREPAGEGESRSTGRRILFVPPLGISFRVEPHHQVAVVLRAWVFRLIHGNGEDAE